MTRYSKSDLVEAVAASTTLYSKAEVNRLFDLFLAEINRITSAGDTVQIHGFGIFAPRSRAARMGRNPGTGAPVEIAASTTLGFKAAKPKKAGA